MKTLNFETVLKVTVLTFISITLLLVSIELFSDLTALNRAF